MCLFMDNMIIYVGNPGVVCACSVMFNLLQTHGLVAHQAPLFMGFPRQGHWSGLPFPTSRDLPDQGIEPQFLVSSALAGGFFTTSSPKEFTK